MGSSQFNAEGNPKIDYHPIQSLGKETLLISPTGDKHWPDGLLGSDTLMCTLMCLLIAIQSDISKEEDETDPEEEKEDTMPRDLDPVIEV